MIYCPLPDGVKWVIEKNSCFMSEVVRCRSVILLYCSSSNKVFNEPAKKLALPKVLLVQCLRWALQLFYLIFFEYSKSNFCINLNHNQMVKKVLLENSGFIRNCNTLVEIWLPKANAQNLALLKNLTGILLVFTLKLSLRWSYSVLRVIREGSFFYRNE